MGEAAITLRAFVPKALFLFIGGESQCWSHVIFSHSMHCIFNTCTSVACINVSEFDIVNVHPVSGMWSPPIADTVLTELVEARRLLLNISLDFLCHNQLCS